MSSKNLRFRLIVRETEEEKDSGHILETKGIVAANLNEAYRCFTEQFNGMAVHSECFPVPCAGYFEATSDEFAGMFWEIVGAIADYDWHYFDEDVVQHMNDEPDVTWPPVDPTKPMIRGC
jgi:hypothetical protein